MEYIYSAMVLHSLGKPITEDGVTSVLKAAGAEPDASRIKALQASLDGVDIEEAIKTAVVAPAAAPAAAPAGAAAAEPEDEPEEEKGASAEEAAAGLGALFG